MKDENKNKSHVPKAARVMLTVLAVGFTLISMWNGFAFYRVLFGLSMAALISGTFEITRLVCLFSFARKGKAIGAIGIVTYVVVAGACTFASINSFTYDVILRERAGRDQYREQIHHIKTEYSRNVAENLSGVAKEIDHAQKVLTRYPESRTWKRRLSAAVAERDRLVADRDRFLEESPENPVKWIEVNAALLGLELGQKSQDNEQMEAVTLALRELWCLKKAQAQTLIGIVVTAVVELSIFLMALLASVADRGGGVAEKATEKATAKPDDELLKKFVEAYRDLFMKTGELPPARKLSRKFREVRKTLESYSNHELEGLFKQ